MKQISYTLISVFILTIALSCNSMKSGQHKTDTASSETKKDKNVLFIMVDDLNPTLATYDHPVVKTPNIDRLAQMGVQYDNAHCNFSVCGPSRSSLLTGLYPESIGVTDNKTPLSPLLKDKTSLPKLFKDNGYETVGMGKIFHGTKEIYWDPNAWDGYYRFKETKEGKQGVGRNLTDGKLKWCRWLAAEGGDEAQQDGQIAKKAIEVIKTKREKPFFLAVGFKKPHDPFVAPKEYFDMYPLEACNPPVIPDGWEPAYPHSLPGENKIFKMFTDQEKREFLRSYYACTTFMDAQLGKILDALEETGQMDNTLIVFFGDHGYHLGEHDWWNKVTLFEKGTKAPFIIAGNSVGKKGVRSNSMFEFVDIYPTMVELMNLKNAPTYLEGKSFTSIVSDPDKPFRTEVNAITRRGPMLGRTVKNHDWRYIEWDSGKRGRELYNQHTDPIEYNNLADNPEYAKIVEEMSALIKK